MSAPALLAKALFDNLADAPDELSFRKGDIITVLEQDVDGLIGWWLCSLHGRQGIAPGNRLQQIKRRSDEQASPELTTSSEVFTFEDIDYDVPRPQEGEDYAVPRGIRSPDYDVPNADSQDDNLFHSTPLAFDISGKQHRIDNNVLSTELYDVPSTLLDDDIPGDVYDIPSKSADQEGGGSASNVPQNLTVTSNMSPSPCQETLVGENDRKQHSVVSSEPDIYSEIYDVPVICGDEDNNDSIEKLRKGVSVSLDINTNSSPQESINSVSKLANVGARLSGTSSDGKRQSSSSTDSVKFSSEDDDYVDYQDIYGDGREQEVNVYDVPVQPISLQDEGQSFSGGPNSKRTQVSILQRINMSAVKELKLDPSAALQRLAKLEQAVNVTVSKLLSFVTTSWRNPNFLKPQLADIRDIAGKAKVALRLLTEFGLSSLVNARNLPSQELSGRLSRAIEPLLETYYSVKMALQRLDGQDWRLPLDKTDSAHDDLDLIMVHIRPVPENTQSLATTIRSAATTLYYLEAKKRRDKQASQASGASVNAEELKTCLHVAEQAMVRGPEKRSGQSKETIVKDAVDTNFKPRSNGGKWSPTTVRRVCGMDTRKQDSAGYNVGSEENKTPTLPLRKQTSKEKIKDNSYEDDSKSSPPPPPQRKDSSEKCQHLRQKSIDKFPSETIGAPPPKPKLDRKNTTRKSYKIPLFTGHNHDNENILRRNHKESVSEPPATRRKCNSDPTQLLEQNKEAAEKRRMTQSSDKNKVAALMKQTTVHVSDSDLPQSLRQSATQFEGKGNSKFPSFDVVDKPLQHRPLSNLIKGDGTSNGVMVSLNDRELLEFYKYEIDAQLFVLSEAVKSFFAVVEKAESPKVFVSNSKFIVLSAHKFVYIGDTLSKRIKHGDLRSHVMGVTNKLSNCIKILVSATKSAALQYPASNAIKEMSDAVVVVNDVAVELYQTVKKTTKG